MGDNYIPSEDVVGDWETPAEINHSWGWDKNDSDFKAPSDVLFHLVDIVGKGGNYLLNIGPTALGEIPIVAAENFQTVGRWLKVNGEVVYGAKKSPFGEGLKNYIGPLKDEKTGRTYSHEFRDWRCTTRPGKLYFTVFRWTRNFKLPAFPNAIKRAYMLTAPETDLAVTVEANGDRVIAAPQYGIDVMANVIVVEVDGGVAPTYR
jgi:alpha-L-fucosidase